MKKLLLTLSAPVLALSPVVAVVACGKESTVDKDTQSIKDLLKNVVNSKLTDTDLASVTNSDSYTGAAKTAIETEIKKLIKGDSEKEWGTGDAINTFDEVSFEFTFKGASAQAITITVKGTKNNKSSSKDVVITGTAAGTVNQDQADVNAVKSAIDAILTTGIASTKDMDAIDGLTLASINKDNFHTEFGVTDDISSVDLKGATIAVTLAKTAGAVDGASYAITITISKGTPTKTATSTVTYTSDDYDNTAGDPQDDVDAVQTEIDAILTADATSSKDADDLDTDIAAGTINITNFHTVFGVDTDDISGVNLNGATIAVTHVKDDAAPTTAGAIYTITITITKGSASATSTVVYKSNDWSD